MPNLLKKFFFWFVLFSLIIIFINASGNDDKNLLIYLTNPLNSLFDRWLTNINTNPDTSSFFQPIIYLLHMLFWGALGHAIDAYRMRRK